MSTFIYNLIRRRNKKGGNEIIDNVIGTQS
jgi:hypothetical protein